MTPGELTPELKVLIDAEIADQGGGGGGGSLPEPDTVDQVLTTVGEATGEASPTPAELDAARSAPLLQLGWVAGRNYQAARAEEVPGATDNVQLLKPAGTDNLFIAEATEGFASGLVEPDWDGEAPNSGDTVDDGDFTWTNIGPYSAWPFTPAAWQSGHVYTGGELVWPTTPNGHLYIAYPAGLTSDVTEPVFPTDGSYVADNDGYWWDAGVAVEPAAAWQAVLLRQIMSALAALGFIVDAAGNLVFSIGMQTVTFQIDPPAFTLSDTPLYLFGGDDNPYTLIASDKDGVQAWGLTDLGMEYFVGTSAPADGAVSAGNRIQWYDDTNDKALIRFKQKDAGGSLTAGVSLASVGSQDTVGSAGGASALPATPSKWIKIRDANGDAYVIPAFAVS